MALDHRLLHRMQPPHRMLLVRRIAARDAIRAAGLRLQVLDGEQRLAMERRQELDAGIDRLQPQSADHVVGGPAVDGIRGCELAHHHRAGAAIAFVAALLGAGAAGILAQPVEHRAGRMDIRDFDDPPLVEEADRLCGGG